MARRSVKTNGGRDVQQQEMRKNKGERAEMKEKGCARKGKEVENSYKCTVQAQMYFLHTSTLLSGESGIGTLPNEKSVHMTWSASTATHGCSAVQYTRASTIPELTPVGMTPESVA